MRREYINYSPSIPVNIGLFNMTYYPIHWHNALEIIFVLKGTVKVTIETQTFIVEESKMEIINRNEAHKIECVDGDNEVLIFNIDPCFFEGYYDLDNVYFYTDSTSEGVQEEEKYYVLRKYLSMLLFENVQKQKGYEESVQNILLELLFHLINNFHQLIYEEESLKDDEVQFKRYERIIKYIYDNYMYKISLQDIAKMEHLSSNYLSNKIKNNMGYGFNDFLNLTRVEESIKLLLDTDKNISEISEEMGFSHIRYFNKYFKKYCRCTPMQYRKKNMVDSEKYEKLKLYNVIALSNALKTVSLYLDDYNMYNYDNKVTKIDVDISSEGHEFNKKFLEVLDIGYAVELLNQENHDLILMLKRDIEFKYFIIHGLFSPDMNIFWKAGEGFVDWWRIKSVLKFLIDIEVKPVILLDKCFEGFSHPLELLDDFISYFIDVFGENQISKWRFQIDKSINNDLKNNIKDFLDKRMQVEQITELDFPTLKEFNPIYDTCLIMPYIFKEAIDRPENTPCFKAIDSLYEKIRTENELLVSGRGLLSPRGIKKPSYYSYNFLSMLGDEVITKGDGFIATRDEEDIQILLYNYEENMQKFNSAEFAKAAGKNTERRYSINIFNLPYDYRIIKYELNEKNGSIFDLWTSIGKPSRVNEEDMELLRRTAVPKISLGLAKKSTVFNIQAKVERYGGTLIKLMKVQKTP